MTEYKTSYYQERPNEAAKAIAIVGKHERTGVRGVTVLNKSSNVGAETTTVRPVSGYHSFTPINREVSSIDVGLPKIRWRSVEFDLWTRKRTNDDLVKRMTRKSTSETPSR